MEPLQLIGLVGGAVLGTVLGNVVYRLGHRPKVNRRLPQDYAKRLDEITTTMETKRTDGRVSNPGPRPSWRELDELPKSHPYKARTSGDAHKRTTGKAAELGMGYNPSSSSSSADPYIAVNPYADGVVQAAIAASAAVTVPAAFEGLGGSAGGGGSASSWDGGSSSSSSDSSCSSDSSSSSSSDGGSGGGCD